jgi:hypothetical protein
LRFCLAPTSILPDSGRHQILASWRLAVPDGKKNVRLIATQAIIKALKELKISFPHSDKAHDRGLKSAGRSQKSF